MKKVAVTQSNYIPWRGYFDMIKACDIVILLDDVQFTRRDWRNRNKIKTQNGAKWLTIPVDNKGHHAQQRIFDTQVSDAGAWATDHFNKITQAYKSAPHYKTALTLLEPLYHQASELSSLSQINFLFLQNICDYLNIKTPLKFSTDYFVFSELDSFSSTERLLKLCQQENATHYVSGPAAQSYMDCSLFTDANINIQWADYSNYPNYTQQHGAFDGAVSLIDLMFNIPQAEIQNYLKKVV